jgi:DNA-binding response OmpR family regulator
MMKKKILIIEDEFVVANALRLTLEQAGYNVTGIAASAEDADEQLQLQRPDFVLLDIQLEGKRSGIDLAKKLNEDPLFICLPIPASRYLKRLRRPIHMAF